MKLTAEMVKEKAKSLGADVVGIGNIERWEGTPIQMDPKQIMPDARSVIAMGFRIMRGSLRGIEEGTFFSNYSSMGYGGLTYLYIPIVVINLSKFIEDFGYEAIPYGHQSDWRAIDNEGNLKPNYSKPVTSGKANPDVMVHLRIAAYLCGLGEIGYSKLLLTPEFGPRQRIGIVITEAPLEPDPLIEPGTLCDRCMACVKECPGNAISRNETVKVVLAEKKVEWGKLDCKACDIAFRGGKPIKPEEDDGSLPDYMDNLLYGYKIKPNYITPFYRKPHNLYNTGQAICGARCMISCMIHLEKKGILKNKFEKPFRRKEPWKVNW
ncbi:MAG TPA: 4Fe-4S binding protein [bacterium]|nr:4Fe-4S binding protein [bacterium]HOM26088.1 4Fe-4S binding protein [bacterium]